MSLLMKKGTIECQDRDGINDQKNAKSVELPR